MKYRYHLYCCPGDFSDDNWYMFPHIAMNEMKNTLCGQQAYRLYDEVSEVQDPRRMCPKCVQQAQMYLVKENEDADSSNI